MRQIVSVLAVSLAAGLWSLPAHAACGDGFLDENEDCETTRGGVLARDVTCQDVNPAFVSGTLGCNGSTCRFTTSACSDEVTGQLCGNGVREPGEACDQNTCDCAANCVYFDAMCGNGCLEGIEECDDGAQNSDTLPDACRTECVQPKCGDNVVDSAEQCDEGSLNSDFVPDACRADCSYPRCGDGVIDVQRGEQCDLGAQNSDAIGSVCNTQCIIPYCGNGNIEAGEACDDGNLDNGDDCTRLCRPAVCGDGFVWVGVEVCDSASASCDYACSGEPALCGNGNLDAGEACDAGAANAEVPGAPCRTDCTLPRCGDAVVDAGEACDRSPGCLSDCTLLP